MKRFVLPVSALSLLLLLVLPACNSQKNTWFNRNWQNMNARFNGYFNGKEKMKEAVEQLRLSHIDHFERVIDVFPYADEAQAKAISPAMDEVMKKGSFIIQKYPLSKWVDDSYLLIGKAYFFKRDYFAGIEILQFITSRYKDQPIKYEALIWLLKTYLYQEKYAEAEALLSQLKSESRFPDKFKPEYHAVAAAIMIKQAKYTAAIDQMKVAVATQKSKKLRYRWYFILGQLYLHEQKMPQAIAAFEKMIKLNPPYEFAFNAKINIARAVNKRNKNAVREAKAYLRKMLRDDKNISFFDQIYFELGNLDLAEKDEPQAIKDYTSSTQTSTENPAQKAKSFVALADLYFGQPNYTLAQAFYDSAVGILPKEAENYTQVAAKRNKLSELIINLVTIHDQDSLLKLAKMDRKKLDKFIADRADEDKQAAELKKLEEERAANNPDLNKPPQMAALPGSGNAGFYFDNKLAVTRGVQEFRQRYGNRKLQDNWRISAREQEQQLNNNTEKTEAQALEEGAARAELANIPADLHKYYESIPFTSEEKEEAQKKIAEAMFNVGTIYFEQLEDLKEAIKAYEAFLKRFPGNEHEPQALYNLYRIHTRLGNKQQAADYKKKLDEQYTGNDYQKLANNEKVEKPVSEMDSEEKKIAALYEQMYNAYNSGNYAEVKRMKQEVDARYAGSFLQPKFDLLEAYNIARTDSIGAFKKALTEVATTHQGTPEGVRAQEIIDAMSEKNNEEKIKDAAPSIFKYAVNEPHFYLLITDNGTDMNAVKVLFTEYLATYHADGDLEFTSLLLNNKQLVLVKEFTDKKMAAKFLDEMQKAKEIKESKVLQNPMQWIITKQNFGILLNNPNFDDYSTFFKDYYSQ